MSKVSISQIINYSYVRYDRLTELINFEYKDSKDTKINIFIDLYSILKPLYSSNITIDDYSEVTSCIINMCAHYRYFFQSRYNVQSRIYLIWSKNIPYKNCNVYPEYNAKFGYTITTNKKITSLISDNLNLLETLCPYIPDVMYVTDLYEVGVIANYISKMQDNFGIPGLFISRDCYNYQLSRGKYDMKVLVPYKVHTNEGTTDMSYIVSDYNCIDWYLNKLQIKFEPGMDQYIPGSMLSLLMALSRCPTRNIVSLKNIPRAYKDIAYLIDAKIIPSSHIYDTDAVAEALHINKDALKARYYICDIPSQEMHYNLDPAINIHQSMINLYDANEVKNINNKYFIKYPLDLNRL